MIRPATIGTAVISDCGNYRYELRRVWDTKRPTLVTCMLNPSTADANKNDPTILRLIGFADRWRYGGIMVINLFTRRSSSPYNLRYVLSEDEHGVDGPSAMQFWERAFNICIETGQPMLAAWGADGRWMERGARFTDLAQERGISLTCLNKTMHGFPTHPLARGKYRISNDAHPRSFP